jgi:tRNA A-37 threonylcarbamoyl transferase component Bud32/tetratricopeptide (TPR) repeat protein
MAETDTRLIQGRYRLQEVIGRGGMGEVWRATDESLERRVAVKCLRPLGQQRDPAHLAVLRERFRREARVAAALQHRGITVVHDFGESDGCLFLVMELLDGRNLSQLMTDNGKRPLPVDEVVDIAEQVADALAYTHRQGVVHRDLKPANIMRLTDGTVKICDFGIARLGADMDFTSRLTGTGIAMGTPHYMSPEQIGGGGEVDHRSDLYSLGCVLYEVATGVPPFDMDDTWAILIGHRDTIPAPLRSRRPELPGYLDLAVLDLLAKAPEARPADAAELGRRLVSGRTGHTPAGPSAAAPVHPLPAWARTLAPGRPAASSPAGQAAPAYDPAATLTTAWTQAGPGSPADTPPAGTSTTEIVAVLAGRHRAGLGLGRLGRWTEAADLLRTVVRDRAHVLGDDHPDTLASGYELGFALSRLGRATDALDRFAAVAEGRARTLGGDHPDTLAARQESAYVLGGLGRHAEAHDVYETVLAARERTMGAEHPDTLRCRHNLAFTLGRIGRVTEAYATAREVADARTRLLGADHPDTLATRHEIGHALGRLGRWADALAQHREVAEARRAVLGADHSDTLAARYETGICLGRLGRAEEATVLYRDLVGARTRANGPDHPETLRARHGLGVNLGRLGSWDDALAEARTVRSARARVLGSDHPDTLASHREAGIALGHLGRWPEALAEYRHITATRTRLLGPGHPATRAALADENHCRERLGGGAGD